MAYRCVPNGSGWYVRHIVAALENARDEGIEQGREQGIEQGQDMINTLNIRLIEDGRLDDLKRAAEDSEFRERLMEEYRIK